MISKEEFYGCSIIQSGNSSINGPTVENGNDRGVFCPIR